MLAYRGLRLYSHGQDGLPTIFSLFAAIFSPFAAILEKFNFFVLGPLVGPQCTVQCTVGSQAYIQLFWVNLEFIPGLLELVPA